MIKLWKRCKNRRREEIKVQKYGEYWECKIKKIWNVVYKALKKRSFKNGISLLLHSHTVLMK